MEYFTASALNGVPSWNVTPSRSLKVQERPSAAALHSVARPGENGSALPAGFAYTSGS